MNPSLTSTARWLWNLVRPYSKWIFLSALSALVLVGFNILRASLVASLVENALQGDMGALSWVTLLLVPAAIIALLATWVSEYGANRSGILAARDLKNHLINHILRAQTASIERYQTGNLLTRLNKDISTVKGFISKQFPSMLFQPLMFLSSSIYLLNINWKLFSACYILLPFTFKIATGLNKRGAEHARDYLEGLDTANSMVQECMDGIVTVKTYNLESNLLGKCRRAFDNVLGGLMKKELCDAVSLPFYFLTYESPRIICILVGGYLTLNGEMGIGELVAATQLVGYVSAPAFALMRIINGTRQTGVAVNRLAEILSLPVEPGGRTNLDPHPNAPAIQFQDVNYGYQEESMVLENLNLTVPRHGLTALVGISGGGKSTILSLLSCFYQPQAGKITIFGHGTNQHSPGDLRNFIAYVPQDNLLFPGTILDNIRMGNSNATEQEIQDAIRISNSHEFLSRLPQGLETQLNESGGGLSGGQRQRLAMARAALKKAPLLVLDEPTSALDPVSEALINQALQELAHTKAVLVVSHRLSTIVGAQKIIVIQDGNVVEEGDYQELVGKNGVFARIFAAQISAQEGKQYA